MFLCSADSHFKVSLGNIIKTKLYEIPYQNGDGKFDGGKALNVEASEMIPSRARTRAQLCYNETIWSALIISTYLKVELHIIIYGLKVLALGRFQSILRTQFVKVKYVERRSGVNVSHCWEFANVRKSNALSKKDVKNVEQVYRSIS